MSLSHAKHNKKACQHLLGVKQFNDWVITTAFYSALHFMHSVLFPDSYEYNTNGDLKKFNSFETFYSALNTRKSKHRVLLDMVEEHIADEKVIDAFTTLKELCWTARYSNYQQSGAVANESYNNLELIEEYCDL